MQSYTFLRSNEGNSPYHQVSCPHLIHPHAPDPHGSGPGHDDPAEGDGEVSIPPPAEEEGQLRERTPLRVVLVPEGGEEAQGTYLQGHDGTLPYGFLGLHRTEELEIQSEEGKMVLIVLDP